MDHHHPEEMTSSPSSSSEEGDDVSLSEIVELPSLGTSYDSLETNFFLGEEDYSWDYYNQSSLLYNLGDCDRFFFQENVVVEEENIMSPNLEGFLWEHHC